MKDLITTESLVPETLFASLESVEDTVNRIRTAATSVVFDVSTRKGQEDTKSMAYKVSQTKSAGVKGFEAFLKEKKEEIKNYNSRKKTFVDSLDDLRDEIRKPVTEMEEKEKQRIADHENDLDSLTNWLSDFPITNDINYLVSLFDQFKALHAGREWEEYQDGADRIFAKGSDAYETKKAQLEEAKRLAEENAKLRREAEEREQKDREERIAREAVEKARREEAEKREVADRKAKAEREAEQQRLRDAEEAKLQAERDALEAQRREIEQAKQAELAAQAAKLAEIARHEQEEIRHEKELEAAAQAERDRIAEEQRKEEAEAAARAADKAHRAAINNRAVECMVQGGVSVTAAKKAVTLIAQGKVEAVTITY